MRRMWASGKCRTVCGYPGSASSSKPLLSVMQLSLSNALNALSRRFGRRDTANTRSGVIVSSQPGHPASDSRHSGPVDYLLTCFKHSKYTVSYDTVPISEVRSDQQLFEILRALYAQKRKSFTKWFSLRQLRAIQFVQVNQRSTVRGPH